jgi:hypothetical protein
MLPRALPVAGHQPGEGLARRPPAEAARPGQNVPAREAYRLSNGNRPIRTGVGDGVERLPSNVARLPNSGERRPNVGDRAIRPGVGDGVERLPSNVARLPNSGERRPNVGNRPDWANRPGAGGSGERWPNAGNRPDWPNRPGAGGSGERWPNVNDRPNWSNRNNYVANYRAGQTNNTFVQNNLTQNNISANRFNSFNGQHWGYNYYHANWAGWHSGSWENWHSCPAAWYTAGAATAVGASWLWGAGAHYAYSNPFYQASPTVVTVPALDYSQPIQVPTQTTVNVASSSYVPPATDAATESPPTPADSDSQVSSQSGPAQVPPEATRLFDDARAAFKLKNYDTALMEVEEAIKLLPKDATLHEFRALVLFSQNKYKEAAAGVYAVLAVGPGWNWATLSGLYANPDNYTKQLRDLEAYARNNPTVAEAHFLLAYHYLVIESVPEAVKQLKRFEKLVPSDQLSPELVKAFTESPDTGKPRAAT